MEHSSDIKVSVNCITYNHEKYIRRCLESLVSQKTNFKYEILVHDDASTDSTTSIIKEYELKYPDLVKPIYQQENQYSQGIQISYAYQYPRSRGKYIAMCEGDDYWSSNNKLQTQFDIMEMHPQCCLCTHKVQHICESGEDYPETTPNDKVSIVTGIVPHEKAERLILYRRDSWPFHTSSFFYRKDVLLRLFEEDAEYRKYLNGDLCMLLNALTHGSIYYIDEKLSNYRRFAKGSFTSRERDKKNDDKDKFIVKTVKGELMFDQFTEYRYHEMIMRGVCERLTACTGINRRSIKAVLEQLGISRREMNISLWNNNKYRFCLFYLQLFFPNLRNRLSRFKMHVKGLRQK